MFIRNFAKRANSLVHLTCKDVPFEFGPEQLAAQKDLKEALLALPTLWPLSYTSKSSVILAVDSSAIAVGFYLCQKDPGNLKRRYFARFSSILFNDQEQRFSQPKLELYRLFCALCMYKIFLVGIWNLIIEVDA